MLLEVFSISPVIFLEEQATSLAGNWIRLDPNNMLRARILRRWMGKMGVCVN